jgi:hypothetical protein
MGPLRPLVPLAVALVAASSLAGCALQNAAAPAPQEAAIRTDQPSYVLERRPSGWEVEIGFEYTNRTDRTISLLNCRGAFGFELQKWEGGAWVTAWVPALPLCLSPPIEIAPGATFPRTLAIFAGHPESNVHPQFRVDDPEGSYRIVVTSAFWDYDHDGPPWGTPVPLEHRASNTFELRTP